MTFTFPSTTGLVLVVPPLCIWAVLLVLDWWDRRRNPERYEE
jgi:hypothetical protein